MRHWCPVELVPYGWGHYSEGPSPGVTGMVKSNQVQPAPALQSDLTEENKSQQSYGDNESEHNDNYEKGSAHRAQKTLTFGNLGGMTLPALPGHLHI